MNYLVFIKTNGKINPQLWSDDFSNSIETRYGEIVRKFKLNDDEKSQSLDEVTSKYLKVINEENSPVIIDPVSINSDGSRAS